MARRGEHRFAGGPIHKVSGLPVLISLVLLPRRYAVLRHFFALCKLTPLGLCLRKPPSQFVRG